MKHRNKFQSSKLLVVWLVFLSLRFSAAHSVYASFCLFIFFLFVYLFLFSIRSFIHSQYISFALRYRTTYTNCRSIVYNSLSNFFLSVFFLRYVTFSIHSLYTRVSVCVFVCFTIKMFVLNIAPSTCIYIYQFQCSIVHFAFQI